MGLLFPRLTWVWVCVYAQQAFLERVSKPHGVLLSRLSASWIVTGSLHVSKNASECVSVVETEHLSASGTVSESEHLSGSASVSVSVSVSDPILWLWLHGCDDDDAFGAFDALESLRVSLWGRPAQSLARFGTPCAEASRMEHSPPPHAAPSHGSRL